MAQLSIPEKLKRYSTEADSGCVEWQRFKNPAGYGQVNVGKRKLMLAHRAAYMVVNGPIPDGLCVLHKCDNPACINVEHLFLGTQLENIADMKAKGRANAGPGQGPGEKNPMHKLTTDQVFAIKGIVGVAQTKIAEMFGISQTTVWQIRTGKRWAHLGAA